jgi:hypothetical protein
LSLGKISSTTELRVQGKSLTNLLRRFSVIWQWEIIGLRTHGPHLLWFIPANLCTFCSSVP